MADANKQAKGNWDDKFRQLEVDLPTPNTYRTASGAPGGSYWQQQADYAINATLDEAKKRITATRTITYRNNSPHSLNVHLAAARPEHLQAGFRFAPDGASPTHECAGRRHGQHRHAAPAAVLTETPHGFEIQSVTDGGNGALHYVDQRHDDADRPAGGAGAEGDRRRSSSPGRSTSSTTTCSAAASGYEHFRDNDTYTFFQAQWFPRLVAYTDYTGWQHKQFLGSGEFTLEFGNYDVVDHRAGGSHHGAQPACCRTRTRC